MLLQVAGVSRGTRACSGLSWWFSTLRGYTGLHAGGLKSCLSCPRPSSRHCSNLTNKARWWIWAGMLTSGREHAVWFPARTSNGEICCARRLPHWHRPQRAGLRHVTLHVTTCACHKPSKVKGLVWPRVARTRKKFGGIFSGRNYGRRSPLW